MAVREFPGGILPRDLTLTLAMAPAAPKTETVIEGVLPQCVDNVFICWKVVIKNILDGSVLRVLTVAADNSASPVPYPDGCFRIEVFLVGCLVPAACIEWSAGFEQVAGDGFTGLDGFNLFTDTDNLPTGTGCNAAALVYFTSFPSFNGSLVGSDLLLDATLNGESFGPTITFACDPSAFASSATAWDQEQTDGFTLAPSLTFAQFPADGGLYYVAILVGLLWDNPDNVTWTVTQQAGPPIPDPSYATVASYQTAFGNTIANCAAWMMVFTSGYDYSGTIFNLEASLGGNPFGPSLQWTCEV